MAIIRRWRWPPETSCGYLRRMPPGPATGPCFSSSSTRSRSAFRRATAIEPVARPCGVCVGGLPLHQLVDLGADGEDRIERRERILRHEGDLAPPDLGRQRRRGLVSRLRPSKVIVPEEIRAEFCGSTPRIERASVVLPQPLSPTRPTISPRPMRKVHMVEHTGETACRSGSRLRDR